MKTLRKLLIGLALIVALAGCGKKDQQSKLLHFRSLVDSGWSKGGVSYQLPTNHYKKVYSGVDLNAWIETVLDGDVLGGRYKGKFIVFQDYLHDNNPFSNINHRGDIRLRKAYLTDFRIDNIILYDKNGGGYQINSNSQEYKELENLCKTEEFRWSLDKK